MVVPVLSPLPYIPCPTFLSGLQSWLSFWTNRIENTLLSERRSPGAWDTADISWKPFHLILWSPSEVKSGDEVVGRQEGICFQIWSLGSGCCFSFWCVWNTGYHQEQLETMLMIFPGKVLDKAQWGWVHIHEMKTPKVSMLGLRCLSWLLTFIHKERGMPVSGLDFLDGRKGVWLD